MVSPVTLVIGKTKVHVETELIVKIVILKRPVCRSVKLDRVFPLPAVLRDIHQEFVITLKEVETVKVGTVAGSAILSNVSGLF